jgi:hypothetical protein
MPIVSSPRPTRRRSASTGGAVSPSRRSSRREHGLDTGARGRSRLAADRPIRSEPTNAEEFEEPVAGEPMLASQARYELLTQRVRTHLAS